MKGPDIEPRSGRRYMWGRNFIEYADVRSEFEPFVRLIKTRVKGVKLAASANIVFTYFTFLHLFGTYFFPTTYFTYFTFLLIAYSPRRSGFIPPSPTQGEGTGTSTG